MVGMKLEPDNQINFTKETLVVLLDAYGISDFTFESISEGIANSSARIESGGKKYVMRVYAQGKNDDDILFEINFQDYLRVHGIPIPVIHKSTGGSELVIAELGHKRWQVILMDFVEGKSVTIKPSHKLIAELAHLQAKMHLLGMEFVKNTDKPQKPWTDLHDSLVSKVRNTTVGGREVRDLLQRIKAYRYPLSPDLPYGYNHLDIDFDGNVLTKGERVSGIVDFDDLQYSPLIVCLGYSLWNILDDEGIDAMKHYLREYEKVRLLTPIEYEALPNVVFFRNYVLCVVRLLLWDENTPIEDITNLICLEKDIPKLLSPEMLK
jgi:Ser/Thr protein kinase RdoA (MazF antagonist)